MDSNYDQLPPDPHSKALADRILAAMPEDLPKPEVYVDNAGWTTLDWQRDRFWVVSASASTTTSALAVACVLGEGKSWSGVIPFDSVFPQQLTQLIKEVMT